jgi:hypothetical protein
MDLRSLNSGSTADKQWLNPVVGDLKAKTVSSSSYQVTDEESQYIIPLSGGIYRRAAGNSPAFTVNPITPPFGAGMVDIANTNATVGGIPIDALVPGCSYELYFSGKVLDASTATSGVIVFYPCFKETQPTDYPDCMTEIPTDYGANAFEQGFEVRLIFRVVTATDTSVRLECSWTSTMNLADVGPAQVRQFTNTGSSSMNTPSRAASVTKTFPFTIWAKSQGGPYTLTRTQLYLRRIS